MEIGFKNCQHTPKPQTNDCLGAETLVRLLEIILEGSTIWTTMFTLSQLISVDPTLLNNPDHYDLTNYRIPFVEHGISSLCVLNLLPDMFVELQNVNLAL